MINVERVDRVAIGVRDLEKAMAFFSKTLGITFDVVREHKTNQYKATYSNVGLELLQPTSKSNAIAKFIDKKGEGLISIIFKVSDLEEAKKELEIMGIRLINEVSRGNLKEAIFHPKDFYNVEIALCEYEAPHPASCAALYTIDRMLTEI
jgi:methylmalonyl-CoA/ethylmalonyl-CoA epimerase